MLPDLLPGQTYSKDLLDALERFSVAALNARGAAEPGDTLSKYLRLADDATRELAGRLSRRALDHLVLTSAYWHAHGLTAGEAGERVAERELRVLEEALHGASKAIRTVQSALPQSRFVLIPDTNVIMQGTQGAVRTAPWHALAGVPGGESLTIVLLQAVLDELDRHKHPTTRPRSALPATRFARSMTSSTMQPQLGCR